YSMPLAPRFSWDQDASSVGLSVLLPGGALKYTDIYVSDLVLKLNAPPYVLLLDLFALVDDASVVVKANAPEGTLHVTVQKRQEGLWPALTCENTKAALRARRSESMARKSESEAARSDQRRERRHQEEKQTLRAQMAVDDANRQILQDLKDKEKQREECALYESFRELKVQEQRLKASSSEGKARPQGQCHQQLQQQQDHHLKAVIATSSVSSEQKTRTKPTKKVSFASDLVSSMQPEVSPATPVATAADPKESQVLELSADGSFDLPAPPIAAALVKKLSETLVDRDIDDPNVDDYDDDEASSVLDSKRRSDTADLVSSGTPPAKADAKEASGTPQVAPPAIRASVKAIPQPRTSLQSEIHFTPRVFPTPSRESKAAEEEDWLLKNRKHLNKHKGLHGAGAYDISESDPMWLKAKGDDFYRSKDYCGAVNAYSEAFALAPEQSDLQITCLANRAAARLQLLDFDACIADCSMALSFIPDTRESSDSAAGSSMLVHYRLKLKLFVRRGTAYCRVSKFTEAKADYGVALSMDNQNMTLQDDFLQLVAVEKAQELKVAGDQCFREQRQLERAVSLYSDSLRLNPLSIACLSNRAACFLVLNASDKCVQDCSRALELLQRDPPAEAGGSSSEQHSLAFFSSGPAAGSVKRRMWVLKTLVRRGAAFAAMKDWERGALICVG
ncbi:hypothetical protein PybrP1_006419, partial [[Pythium] brassicae (nom. inval.)]